MSVHIRKSVKLYEVIKAGVILHPVYMEFTLVSCYGRFEDLDMIHLIKYDIVEFLLKVII